MGPWYIGRIVIILNVFVHPTLNNKKIKLVGKGWKYLLVVQDTTGECVDFEN